VQTRLGYRRRRLSAKNLAVKGEQAQRSECILPFTAIKVRWAVGANSAGWRQKDFDLVF